MRTLPAAIPPVTPSARDRHGFIPALIKTARDTGVSGCAGDGASRRPAGHVPDAGRPCRPALDKAPAGARPCGAAEQGVTAREIAETIGRRPDLPAGQAAGHFKTFPVITLDITTPDAETRRLPGWEPVRPGLIAGLGQGRCFTSDRLWPGDPATATASVGQRPEDGDRDDAGEHDGHILAGCPTRGVPEIRHCRRRLPGGCR